MELSSCNSGEHEPKAAQLLGEGGLNFRQCTSNCTVERLITPFLSYCVL